MLSHDEDRHLRAIEQRLEADDPALAQMLRSHEPPPRAHQSRAARIAVDIVGGLTFALGALAAVGFLIVFGTILIATGVGMHVAARGQQ